MQFDMHFHILLLYIVLEVVVTYYEISYEMSTVNVRVQGFSYKCYSRTLKRLVATKRLSEKLNQFYPEYRKDDNCGNEQNK